MKDSFHVGQKIKVNMHVTISNINVVGLWVQIWNNGQCHLRQWTNQVRLKRIKIQCDISTILEGDYASELDCPHGKLSEDASVRVSERGFNFLHKEMCSRDIRGWTVETHMTAFTFRSDAQLLAAFHWRRSNPVTHRTSCTMYCTTKAAAAPRTE